MKKKIVSMLLSSVMIVSSLAACGTTTPAGGGQTTQVQVTDDQGNVVDANVKDTATGDVVVDDQGTATYEVKDLYIVVDGTLTATKDSGQDEFVAQWEEAVSAKLGHPVKLHINQLDHSDYAGTISRLLTTGEPGDGSFPDAMIMSATMFRQYQTTGLLWDMASAYDNAEFQSRVTLPNVNLGIRTSDGKQYGFAPTYGNGCVTYVKQSWLDNAGLKIDDIKTFDDYYNMLQAFSGNGTYGVIAAGFGKLDEAPYINYMPEFWQGAYPAIYQKPGTTEWIDGFQEQATIDALDRLAKAYKDGIIDPDTEDAGTKQAREKFFSNDQSTSEGCFTYWAGTWLRTLTNNMDKNDVDNDLGDDRLVQLPPIKEIEDTWGGYLNREAPVWVISDDGDDNSLREQAIFDALFETMLDGDTVQTLWTYGAKGVHWDTKADEFVTNPDDPDKRKEYSYEEGEFHLLPSPGDPNTLWKKNHLDSVLVIAPLTNGFTDNDALVQKGNQFFTTHCVDAPTAASSDKLAEINEDLTVDKTTWMKKVVAGEMTGAEAVAEYQEKWGSTIDDILAELNASN